MNQRTRSVSDASLGVQLAHAIAAKDGDAIRALFSSPVVFRGVTPSRFWEAEDPGGVGEIILGTWFGPGRVITGIVSTQSETIGDVEKVTYRMDVDQAMGPSVIEQVAYYSQEDGRITQMRLVCSGFLPRRSSSVHAPIPRPASSRPQGVR